VSLSLHGLEGPGLGLGPDGPGLGLGLQILALTTTLISTHNKLVVNHSSSMQHNFSHLTVRVTSK
jgi:hypothetical protein